MATWGNIKTWVKANLGKQGDTSLDALLPIFAEAFQLKVERDRNYHFLKTISERTITSAAQEYALPSDYKDDLVTYIRKTSPRGFIELNRITDVEVLRLYAPAVSSADYAQPKDYTISNGTIAFWPWPDADYVIRLIGWRNTTPPVLASADSYTNYWTLKYPDLYVQELTAMGFEEAQELEDADYWSKKIEKTMAGIRADFVARELHGQLSIVPRSDVFGTTRGERNTPWMDNGEYL
jgi:hypothetical protein